MLDLESALQSTPSAPPIGRFPVRWPESQRNALSAIAGGQASGHSPLDTRLAAPLLMCEDGLFEEAESDILVLAQENIAAARQDVEVFISLLHALFVVQRLDVAAALLKDRHDFGAEFALEWRQAGSGPGRVQWEIDGSGLHRFVFDAECLRCGQDRLEVITFHWIFPLLSYYSRSGRVERGSIIINREDMGVTPGLAYCDSRPNFFLVPDYIFVPTRGYAYARQIFSEDMVAWADRAPVALWRGGTTGVPRTPGDWRSLERIHLCELAAKSGGFVDAGIASVVQFDDPIVAGEIAASGLRKEFIPWQHWNRYRYHIDIDGNSSPWSNLFQKLLTGSPVLKVESYRGLQQWYYGELIPWHNYVPVAPDMSDLMDKVRFLHRHDNVAVAIGNAGLELAQRMTYECELERSIPVISAAFRYFRGDYDGAVPYGRVARRIAGSH